MSNDNKFKNRVFGCAVIKSENANYNADFTKQPRTLPNGLVYATDKALKYTVRNYLVKNYSDDKILYFTRNKVDAKKGSMVPMSLKEVFEDIFNAPLPKASKGGGGKKPMIFYFNGEEVEVKCQQVTATNLKKFFKSFEEKPEGIEEFEAIAKNAKVVEIKEDTVNEKDKTEPFYFYINKDNDSVTRIELDEEIIEQRINDIDLHLFGGYDKIKILYNLLGCLDVRLFGATFTGDTNVSIHGPVQINHARDRFLYRNEKVENLSYTEQIKAPFRNAKAKGGDAEMTTIGNQSKSMEAHYVHHFSINPKNLDDHLRDVNVIAKPSEEEGNPNETEKELIGLSQEDIKKLKEGLRVGASYYDSSAKAGTENELLIWVQLKEDSKLVLPNFTNLISVTNSGFKSIIELKGLKELLEKPYIKDAVGRIELYYNNSVTEVLSKPTDAVSIEISDFSKPEIEADEKA